MIFMAITLLFIFKLSCRIDNEFISICKKNHFTDGSTAVVAMISNRNIVVANAGDSRCIVVQKGGRAYAMSVDHKPSR
jgi:serine/threonine protein phosphatase PrpC